MTAAEYLELQLKQLDIHKLVAGKDGVELGARDSKADGHATFYSPKLKALFDVETVNDHASKPKALAKKRVTVRVKDANNVWVLVTDPSGVYESAFYSGKLINGAVTIKSEDNTDDKAVYTFDPKKGDPFKIDKAGLIGTIATMAIKTILRTMLLGVISSVVKGAVTKACLVANPLYTDSCAIVGEMSAFVVGVAIGGLRFKWDPSSLPSWGGPFTVSLANATVGWFEGWACEKATGAALIAWGKTNGTFTAAAHSAVVKQYKRLAWRLNWFHHKLATAAPTDPKKKKYAKAMIRGMHRLLTYFKPLAHEDMFIPYSGTSIKQVGQGLLYDKMIESVGSIAEDVQKEGVNVNIIVNGFSYKNLWKASFTDKQKIIKNTIKLQKTTGGWKVKGMGHIIGCALGVVKGFNGYVTNNTANPNLDIDGMEMARQGLLVAIAFVNKAYAQIWGGAVVDPTCFPDLHEPNNKFVAKGNISGFGGKITLDKLTLKKGDVDWYTLPVKGVISKVQGGAAARAGGSGDCPGPVMAQLCIQLHWYSSINDLTGDPPTKFGKETCGVVGPAAGGNDPQFSTPKYTVKALAGEQNPRLVVRVRHKTAPGSDVPYKLMLFAGKAF